jgi:hypothetical protein
MQILSFSSLLFDSVLNGAAVFSDRPDNSLPAPPNHKRTDMILYHFEKIDFAAAKSG